MNRDIVFIKPGKCLENKVARMIFLVVINTIFIHPFLFSQMTNDTGNSIVIHQECDFSVSPQEVYQILLSSKRFSDCTKKSFAVFSDTSAVIRPVVGGEFSLFDGHIIGRILELIPNERIVEAWRVVDWPAGVYSIARFELKSGAAGGAHLIFDHTGFPQGLKEHLAVGWQQHYWNALHKYFQ